MRNSRGFTLIEILVSLGIGSLALIGFMSLNSQTSKVEKNLASTLSFKGDVKLFSKYIESVVTSGNLRFYAYTDNSIKYRLMVPLPGLCRDLSKNSDCDSSTSLIYARYDKTTSPAVSTICRYNDKDDNTGDEYFIIDLNNETYGPSSFASDGFSVGTIFNSQKVIASNNSLLAFFDPPNVYVWRALTVPQKITEYTQDENTGVFVSAPSVRPFSLFCAKNLQVLKTGTNFATKTTFPIYKLDKLYKVKAVPLTLSEFVEGSGGAIIKDAIINDGVFPLRTFNINLESAGLISQSPGKTNLGIAKCTINSSPKLVCANTPSSIIDGVSQVRVDEQFKISLIASGVIQDQNLWYELISESQTKTPCPGSACGIKPLVLSSLSEIPNLSTSAESEAQLDSSKFSLLKQLEIDVVRFRYIRNNKESFVNVYIP